MAYIREPITSCVHEKLIYFKIHTYNNMPTWFFKYKLYHLLFWSVYHFAWWSIAIGSPGEALNSILFSDYTTKFVFFVVFQALGVYFNLYYLIPKYLVTGKYAMYLLLFAVTIVLTTSFTVSGYYVTDWLSPLTFDELFNMEQSGFWQLFKSSPLSSTIASMTLAMSIKLGKNWIQTRKREELLEKEKIETELKFLKSQFNPHFLFNTINSIFVLIHKNPDQASESLASFSDLLRYQLYECNTAKIPLERELNYVQNFIELGSLRLDNSVKFDFNIDTPASSNLAIAPFVLMPFIENAFKHVSQTHTQDNWLRIELTIENNELQLTVANSIAESHRKTEDIDKNGGIGLANVQRRLDLLYPKQHSLDISKSDQEFHLRLTLLLTQGVEEITAVKEVSFQSQPINQ